MNIDKRDILELKNYANPPADAKFTFDIIMIILNKSPSWKESKLTMGKGDFREQLAQYDYKHVVGKTYEKVITKLTQNPQLTYEKLQKISRACSELIIWIQQWVKISKAHFEKANLEAQMKSLKKTGYRHPMAAVTPELVGSIVAKLVKAQVEQKIRAEMKVQKEAMTRELEQEFDELIQKMASERISGAERNVVKQAQPVVQKGTWS